jgi:hypothetical protein
MLDRYEHSTGQMVSLGNFIMYRYRDQSPSDVQVRIKENLKYDTTCFEEKYLGMPVPEGRMKSGKFQSIKGRFWKRASN